jgi:large subunit ribosomal protein L6e
MTKPARQIARGLTALGRAKTYKRRGLWALKKKNGGKFPVHPKQQKPAAAATKAPRFYPAEDAPVPLAHRVVVNPTKLRESIAPGSVLILLAGRHKGKRVVCLKQLPSGLLLVAGPYKVNGVPARRVNQAYVIATSTKVALPQLDLAKFTDAYFKATETKKKAGEDKFFDTEQQKKELSAEYIANQQALDAALLPALSEDIRGYLSHRFTLRDGDRPHLMKF